MPVPLTAQVLSLVRDSSCIHPYDPDQDGERRLTACGTEHLGELQERYRARPFVKEEVWAGKIARARHTQPDLDEEELVDMTGLNFIQIEHALAWESKCFLREQDYRHGHAGPEDQTDAEGSA
ncbi:hypothetical protein AB0952_24660 [Streptomyces caniferus]|uniref:hypothetical protein n=1 Tax=Streptomyces caniferus TaxID=285557 RepID=UPI003456F23A